MTSKKIDQFLVILGMLLIFISGYQLFLWRSHHKLEGLSLGILSNTNSVVKIKSFSALDWKDAFSGAELGDKQLIYTDAKSSAEIKFLNGAQVQVSENSLIRIVSYGKDNGLKVDKGFIRAKIRNNEPLFISVNGSDLKMTGMDADVQINIQGNSGEIGVLSGEVSVAKGTQIEKITKSEAIQIQAGLLAVKPISLSRVEPLQDQTLFTDEDTHRTNFKWTPEDQGEVLVANNPMMKKSRVFRGNGTASANLRPGTYYWKVENNQGSSLLGSFKVIQETAPKILRPTNGNKIVLAREKNLPGEVFLQWKGELGQGYLIEWIDEENHQKVVLANGLIIPFTKSGVLNWRMKIDSPERPLAQWSDWQNVEVTIVDLPSVPENLIPVELELQSYSLTEELDVELSWTNSTLVDLEILTPKSVRILREAEGSTYLLKVKDPGEYRWRLRGKDQLKRRSVWSEWRSFRLEDLSKEVSSEGFQRIQLKKPDQSVTFTWNSEAGTSTVFELSTSKDFADVVVKKEVTGSEATVVIPQIGDYYWRSRQYNANGTFSVSQPKKVIIEPAPAPTKPEKLPDTEVPIDWEESVSTPRSRWWSSFISEAHAEDEVSKGIATINLPKNEDAKNYVIKIFNDAEGTNLVLERTVEEKILKWTEAKPGQYYWQYALVDFWGRQSPFSDLSLLTVTGVEPVRAVAPKLLAPADGSQSETQKVSFKWSGSKKNKKFVIQISSTSNFETIVAEETTPETSVDLELLPGIYFWQVKASNESKKEAFSPNASFSVLPPLEKITIVDKPEEWQKIFSKRVSLAWAPSQDTFKFAGSSKEGSIQGQTLNSFEARGLVFTEKTILSAEFLRHSGKVFKDKNYLFQRLQLLATWKKKVGNHLWGPGIRLGTVSGFSYEIENTSVKGQAVSGFIYGPHLQGFYTINQAWEAQGKLAYLFGAIPHWEVSTELNRQFRNFYFLFGLGLSQRHYQETEGSQNSVRLNAGLGKEF